MIFACQFVVCFQKYIMVVLCGTHCKSLFVLNTEGKAFMSIDGFLTRLLVFLYFADMIACLVT